MKKLFTALGALLLLLLCVSGSAAGEETTTPQSPKATAPLTQGSLEILHCVQNDKVGVQNDGVDLCAAEGTDEVGTTPPPSAPPLTQGRHEDVREDTAAVESETAGIVYYEEIPLSQELQAAVWAACDEFGVPYALALGLIQTESSFNPSAYNPSGCYGLCQLNPVYFPSGLSPADNIRYGMQYLARQIRVYGSVAAGLTAYNAGHDTGDRGYANAVLGYAAAWEGVVQ